MTFAARSLPLLETSARVAPDVSVQERSRPRRAQAWLALHLHHWPLHAALSTFTAQQRANLELQPIAVLDEDRQRRVLACNAIAGRHGIRLGHSLNAAIALCADTQFLLRDAPREARLLEHMAAWAQRYTPCISLSPPNGLLLEVRGSLRLFGGAVRLMECIQQDLRQQQLHAGLALSPTPRSALWLSRGAAATCIAPPRTLKTQLATLPIQCLNWPTAIEMRVLRFGVTTVGDLLRLPRADLARRIDAACMRELDCALGRRLESRTLFQAPPRYSERVMLDYEIDTVALLEPALERRLEALQRYLRARNLALGHVDFEFKHREAIATRLRLGLAAPTTDMRHVTKLLHEKLAQLTLPAPVLEIQTRVTQLFAAAAMTSPLFPDTPAQAHLLPHEKLSRLLEQLRARLGEAAITASQLHADHRPEHAQLSVAAQSDLPAAGALPASLRPRPLWLLHKPRLIATNAAPPDMQLMHGPERIAGGWWDAAPMQRDYYIAKNARGAWCWIYCDLAAPPMWYLHGLFGC